MVDVIRHSISKVDNGILIAPLSKEKFKEAIFSMCDDMSSYIIISMFFSQFQ